MTNLSLAAKAALTATATRQFATAQGQGSAVAGWYRKFHMKLGSKVRGRIIMGWSTETRLSLPTRQRGGRG